MMDCTGSEGLHAAIGRLLAQCDGARERDGAGFNGYDAGRAREMHATTAGCWTATDARRAWLMLRKYRKQLAGLGIDVDALEPDAALEEESVDRVISLNDGATEVIARFRYSADIVAAVKRVPGARFVGRDQGGPYWRWAADPRALTMLRTGLEWLVREHGFVMSDALRAMLDGVPAAADMIEGPGALQVAPADAGLAPQMPKPSPWVDADGASWYVYNVRGTDVFVEALRAVQALDWNIRRWEPDALRWRVRVSESGAAAVRRLVDLGFRLTDAAASHLTAIGGVDAELDAEIEALPDDAPGLADVTSRSGMTLRPFQRAGVARALHWERSINGFEVGLGKTVVALVTARVANAFPLIVLCQSSKKLDWATEAEEWAPGMTVHVVQGRSDPVPAWADIVVCNYDVLADTRIDNGPDEPPTVLSDGIWRKLVALDPKMVAVDESQLIKNGRAGRTGAALKVIKAARYRLLLSGTAVKNRAGELMSQLDAIGMLERFGGAAGFTARYRQIESINVGGRQIDRERPTSYRAIELHKRLTAWCYYRRTKAEVMPELPPVNRHVVPMRLSNQAEYERARDEFLQWVYETSLTDAEFAAQLPADMTEEERLAALEEHAEEKAARASRSRQIAQINALKRVAARGILPGVIRWVDAKIEADGKLIVFAHHKDIQQALYQAFPGSARLHADDDEETQQAHKARFQSDPNCKLIVVSMGVGATGHTLTAAYQCAFVELGWTPSDHDQAEGRAYGRVNDPHGIDSHWFVATDTIYEWIIDLLDEKRVVVRAILDGIEPEGADSILSELMGRALMEARATRSTGAQARQLEMVEV